MKGRFGDITWIEAYPRTGRLHQIRLHLRTIGHPLLYDSAYGIDGWKSVDHPTISINRTPLHARLLRFEHPFTKVAVELNCPLDDDMRRIINALK